jgi:TetR/AcrR family transcriptional regulator
LTTEETILEVAERLFLENGFSATSTTRIAKEVGCNQALVHYYFRTKENLFNTIFEKKFSAFFYALFETISLKEMSFQEKLTCLIQSHFDLLQANPKMPSLILNEIARQPNQVHALFEKLHSIPEMFFEGINKELQVEIEQGRIRRISLFDLIISILSLNIAQFVILPVAETILQLSTTQKETLLAHRRIENVEFVLKSLRP